MGGNDQVANTGNKNYTVSYTINVDSTKGTENVNKFAESVKSLVMAKAGFGDAAKNIKGLMDDVEKAFRTKNGKKRDYSFKFNIDTAGTENKLKRIKTLLSDIRYLAKAVDININASQQIDTKALRSNAKVLLDKKLADGRKAEIEKNAAASVKTMMETQKQITKVIGKVNAALTTLERGREVNIETDVAKKRLLELLSLMNRMKGASKMTIGVGPGSPGKGVAVNSIRAPFVYRPERAYVLPQAASDKLQERLITNRALMKQKAEFAQKANVSKVAAQSALITIRGDEWDRQRGIKANEAMQRKAAADADKAIRERARSEKQNATQAIAAVRQQERAAITGQTNKQRAAINRMQYVRTPSVRNLPFVGMFNAYMVYNAMKSELREAMEYNNIMTSAQSILRVADSDLGTFEDRFARMALYVRQIGVETKFTATEVGGAVKYLAMAGMGIETINQSIRPITNLALIGDNDVSQIADLATNIMAGYDIKSSSMNSVADILASTISRSNVNVIEMAESYKMAAGYLRMAGVEFSESAAAIGILGNMGVKGTMAGTSLRAMSTRFAKPTREAQKTLDRLGVKFTEYRDIYGTQVEKIRPLADIFEELNKKNATQGDLQAIFGKIAGNAAMMFLQNYSQLRTLTTQNSVSHGISTNLAKVKQENTKGLWDQVTSQFSETYMRGYDILEPIIKSTLRDFLSRFKADEFARGLASIGQSILNILSLLGRVATWFTGNFHWIEPLLFTGFVATRLFKLAGALTNVGVALGFIGKQSAVGGGIQAISSLVGLGSGRLSFGNKRAVVSALSAAGVSGKGAMKQALMSGAGGIAARSGLGLFATQVAVGNGLIGAGASIGALGTSAVVATAGIAALAGALGWVAYKTWQVKEAKDAVTEEINSNRKYRYESIEALNETLNKTYTAALKAGKAVEGVTAGKTIEQASGQKIGSFTSEWWMAFLNPFAMAGQSEFGGDKVKRYTFAEARQANIQKAISILALKNGQQLIHSAYAELGKARTHIEIEAFLRNIGKTFGVEEPSPDADLWTKDKDGKIIYQKAAGNLDETNVHKLPLYAKLINTEVLPEIRRLAEGYRNIMLSPDSAQAALKKGGLDFDFLAQNGYIQDKNGIWVQKPLGAKASYEDQVKAVASKKLVHDRVVKFTEHLYNTWGASSEIAENIMQKAGFTRSLYSNEPDQIDPEPFNANGITFNPGGADDKMAGGNYSGTGKLSATAPKQIVVNITNLLSVETIDLMKSEAGQTTEIQNLKEQMAQALIDVVHDFDASWNG